MEYVVLWAVLVLYALALLAFIIGFSVPAVRKHISTPKTIIGLIWNVLVIWSLYQVLT